MKKHPPSRPGHRGAPPLRSKPGRKGDGSGSKERAARPHRREPEGETRQRPPRHDDRRDRSPSSHESGGRRPRANLFGVHAVRAAFLNPAREIRAVYFTNLFEDDLGALYQQAQTLGLKRPEPEMIERQTLDRMLPKGTVHQNIALDAAPLEDVFLPDLVNKGATRERSIIVLLDQVTDPHNMGAIMRSACAFGAEGIIVQSRHAPDLNGVVAKTASGAMEHLPVVYETNLARAITALKDSGYFALALDERGAVPIGDAPLYAKTLLVMGAEGPGLRPLIREKCDLLVKLPTFGGFSSLNVSNAAAVALYAVATKPSSDQG